MTLEKHLLTVADMATLLSRSESAVRQMNWRKQLPSPLRQGRRLYWRAVDINKWLETLSHELSDLRPLEKRGRGRPSKREQLARQRAGGAI